MKSAGLALVLLLCGLTLSCGCVQIIINPPGFSQAAAPVATTAPQAPCASPASPGSEPAATAPAAAVSRGDAGDGTPLPRFIVPIGDLSRVGHRTFTFNYASGYGGPREYTFRVPVNMSVLYGARQMKVALPKTSQDPAEVKAYIETFESDPAMEELYDSVLHELRDNRYHEGQYLSEDEYLELIVAFVQQIPYVENPSYKRRYPVEVIYDKAGDSDEKSLLLVNLLAREGYDVALLVFEDLGYESTGIRVVTEVSDSSMKVFTTTNREYIFIDAGVPRFIGSVPDIFRTADDPAVYPVGNGTKSYGPVNYVWMVVADLKRMEELGRIDRHTPINAWDRTGTCSWIKNSKILLNTTCYCCDM